MKYRYFLTVILFFLGSGTAVLYGQNLVIRTQSGSEIVKQLANVHSVTFSNNNLVLNFSGGVLETYSVLSISKLYFKAVATGTESLATAISSGKLLVYPNPAGNVLHLQNPPDKDFIFQIYRIDGTLALQGQLQQGSRSINILTLNNGLYLLKINNMNTKFIKQ